MEENIKVHVVKYPDRANLVMRYRDPTTGRHVQRSTGTKNQRSAERAAAKWEAELREGRYQRPSRVTWEEFRYEFDRSVLDGLKPTTAEAYESTLNVFQRRCNPAKLVEVTTSKLTGFVTLLRDDQLAAATIARHLRQLKVAMRWAHRQGLLLKLPQFEMPKQAKGMRGRPITLEEFERKLAAIPKILATKARKEGAEPKPCSREVIESWEFYLRGLWTSGLRLSESLSLRWDEAPEAIVVDMGARRPMLRIPAESEKGNTHRLLPMAPDFAQLLETVPEADRNGWVFRPLNKLGLPMIRSKNAIGPRISEIGAKAGVIVNQRKKLDDDGEEVIVNEFASAHDLRRSFGFRWSRLLMPTILRELMRHESIETTMRYYVGVNAEATADELWRVAGTILGTNEPSEAKAARERIAASR